MPNWRETLPTVESQLGLIRRFIVQELQLVA